MYKLRYELTPQMKEYEKAGQVWLPYTMFFHSPLFSSSSVNTDSRGFRIGYKDGTMIADFEGLKEKEVSLFVGGSSAFGVGASGDRNTIPSLVNSFSKKTWLNFGGRAYCSTQELLLFIMNWQHFNTIKQVVIFSGVNNVYIYYSSEGYSKEIGDIFSGSLFRRSMASSALENVSLLRLAAKRMLSFISPKKYNKILPEQKSEGRDDLLYTLERDLNVWKMLSDSMGFELTYVLQPLANWVRKELSSEEKALFMELDAEGENTFGILKKCLDRGQYEWLLGELKRICKRLQIRFFDMNEALSKKKLDGRWIFVDRIHLTDQGNKTVTEILKEEGICS